MPQEKKQNWKKILILLFIIGTILLVFLIVQRVLKQRGVELSELNPFPFGQGTVVVDEEPLDEEPVRPVDPDAFVGLSRPRFRQITDFPISGFRGDITTTEMISQESITAYNNSRGEIDQDLLATINAPLVRYARKSNSNIEESEVGTDIVTARITNTILPGVEQSYFDKDLNTIIYRWYNPRSHTIKTFKANIPDPKNYFTCDTVFETVYSEGDIDPEIAKLKEALQSATEDTFDITSTYDENLTAAITNFQSQNGVEQTGVLDTAFLALVNEYCQQQESLANNPELKTVNLEETEFLPDDLADFAPSPNDNRFFGLQQPSIRETNGYIFNTDGVRASQSTIFTSPYTEWIPQWVDNSLITLQTKASGLSEGYVFSLSPTSRRVEKIIGNIQGFTSLTSPDGRYILYTETTQNGTDPTLKIWDNDENTTVISNIKTLVEKCVFTQQNELYCAVPKGIDRGTILPDEWYQGTTLFLDNFMRIRFQNGTAVQEFLYDPIDDVRAFDAFDLTLDPQENFIFMRDKHTHQLWSFEIDGL